MEKFTETLACKEANMGTSEKCKTCDIDCEKILNPNDDMAKIYIGVVSHEGLGC